MIDSSILIVNNVPECSDGISGGTIISNRNEKLIKQNFKSVYVYNHIYKNSSKGKNILLSFFGVSLGLTLKEQKKILKLAEENKCDYVFLGYSTLGILAKKMKKKNIKVITFFHNIEYNYFKDHIHNSSLLVKMIGLSIKRCTYLNEGYAVKYSDQIIVLNERDSYELEKVYKGHTTLILPTTFDDMYDEVIAMRNSITSFQKKLLFVGSDFFGNTEGLFWFIEKCLDDINAELIVVGSGMDKYINTYKNKKVTFKGFVNDLSLEYYSADLVVLPILSGSGMKTKTCEALMYGKTIVATKEAFEGYTKEMFETGAGFLCSTASDFITTINSILKTQTSKNNINSRNIFQNNYNTTKYVKKFENIFK